MVAIVVEFGSAEGVDALAEGILHEIVKIFLLLFVERTLVWQAEKHVDRMNCHRTESDH